MTDVQRKCPGRSLTVAVPASRLDPWRELRPYRIGQTLVVAVGCQQYVARVVSLDEDGTPSAVTILRDLYLQDRICRAFQIIGPAPEED